MRPGTIGSMLMAAAALAMPAGARAQGGPEDAARGFVAALDAKRWSEAASMVDPAMARRHQQVRVAMLAATAQFRASGQMRGGSVAITAGDSVSPGLLQRFGTQPAPGYGGARTLAEVARMDPADFMAHTLENALTLPPGACCAAWGLPRYVGTVVENDSVAHALYRDRAEPVAGVAPGDPFAVQLLELRRRGGRWYVIPDDVLLLRGERPMLGGDGKR